MLGQSMHKMIKQRRRRHRLLNKRESIRRKKRLILRRKRWRLKRMLLKRSLITPLKTKVERVEMVQILRDHRIISKSSLIQFAQLQRRACFLVSFSVSPNSRQLIFLSKWMKSWISLMAMKRAKLRLSWKPKFRGWVLKIRIYLR